MKTFSLIVIATCLASPVFAEPTTNAAAFVKMAGASDLYERTSSQIVLKDAKDAKVRDFANMMMSDHAKSTADLVTAAKNDGLTPGEPILMPAQAKMISDLKAAKPANREKVYVRQQIMAHQDALALHTLYAQSGNTPMLKAAAAKIAPVVQTHLDKLKSM